MTPHKFLDARMALAARFRFRETSGYRDPAANADVGGVFHSAHQHFLAVDVILAPGETEISFAEAAVRLGLRPIPEGDHIHLQPASWGKG